MPLELSIIQKALNSLTIRPIEPFSGRSTDNYQVEEFIRNLNDYLTATGKASEQEGKEVLRTSLTGPAKSWFRQQDSDSSFDDLKKNMKERFELTTQQKHVKKMGIFQMTQQPSETFLEYISRVQDKARGIELSKKDLVTIVTQGASPAIRPFLIMEDPDSVEDLMALPLARDESQAKRKELEFVNVTDILTYKDTTSVDETGPANTGYRSSSGDSYRGQNGM